MGRNYSNIASAATLNAAMAAGDTSALLNNYSNYPAPPFTATISRNLPDEEIVLVTAVTGSTVTLTRGCDGTAAQAHSAGASFEHTVVAQDFRDAQSGAQAATDLGTHTAASSGVHGVTGAVVGTTDVQTLTNKTLKAPAFQKSDGTAQTFVDAATVGQASGVASLGSDGKVPSAQIPNSATDIVATVATDQAGTNTTGAPAVVAGLGVTGLAAGVYELTVNLEFSHSLSAGSNYLGRFGLYRTTTPAVLSTGDIAVVQPVSGNAANSPIQLGPASNAVSLGFNTLTISPGGAHQAAQFTGWVRLATAGALYVGIGMNGNTPTIYAGSTLRLRKVL